MTDLAVISTPGALDQYADPGEFVVLACERARDWLRQAIERGDIESIGELKSQAEAVRVYTTQKQLGHDAELAAAEIVRRAERGIGLAIRKGQEAGEIARRGQAINPANQHGPAAVPPQVRISTSAIFKGGKDQTDTYAITDGVTDEQFDAAIDEAKADGNLSRANVKREVARQKILAQPMDTTRAGIAERVRRAREMASTGHTSHQIAAAIGITFESMAPFRKRHGIEVPADAIVGKRRHIDHDRIVRESALSLEGIAQAIGMVEISQLDQTDLSTWATSMRESIKTLNRFLKEINR